MWTVKAGRRNPLQPIARPSCRNLPAIVGSASISTTLEDTPWKRLFR